MGSRGEQRRVTTAQAIAAQLPDPRWKQIGDHSAITSLQATAHAASPTKSHASSPDARSIVTPSSLCVPGTRQCSLPCTWHFPTAEGLRLRDRLVSSSNRTGHHYQPDDYLTRPLKQPSRRSVRCGTAWLRPPTTTPAPRPPQGPIAELAVTAGHPSGAIPRVCAIRAALANASKQPYPVAGPKPVLPIPAHKPA